MAALPYRLRRGNYAPVPSESTQYDLTVTGRLPIALDGIYVRTGPNTLDAERPHARHWFNGIGMLHAVALEQGHARWYKSRYIQPRDHDQDAPRQHASPLACGTGNANVFAHHGRVFAINDQALPFEIDRSLATRGRCALRGALDLGINSHPRIDPRDGTLHTLGYDHEHARLHYRCFEANGTPRVHAYIDVQRPIMAHCFFVTESALVFLDLPVVLDMEAAFAGEPVPYRWNAQHQARIGVAPRAAPHRVEWYGVGPCYVLHGFNAYDEGGDVVIDVVAHDRMFDRCPVAPGETRSRVLRWRVLSRAGRVVEDVLDECAQEFPTINPSVQGRRHRYGFAIASVPENDGLHSFESNVVIKHDFVRGTQTKFDLGADCQASEFTFVPRPGARAEDDGWLLGFVYDTAEASSHLVVLSAARPQDGEVARVTLPRRVPFGFHGCWLGNPA